MDQRGQAHAGALPLRPLTVAELLDAALALLRTRARPLLAVGIGLALAEQALIYPLRTRAHGYFPNGENTGPWWLMIAVGFATEAVAIAVLGAQAAGAVLPALLGRPVPRPRRSRAAIAGSVAGVAIAAGLTCGLAAYAFLLPWFVVYASLGLAAPAVVVDRLGSGQAVVRSIRLVWRSGLRPGAIRVLGYLGWLLFRLALSLGGITALNAIPRVELGSWTVLAAAACWAVVNAIAYPVLGCLDAVLHLEARMRVEGLDIALGRALRRGEPLEPALAVPR
ncbi:MAG TPA: hypothetical protein VFE14_00090 [Micromonosporaceae bacterium]|jgi:hypothetical protein|nr:hypothetical protein [Micromonosporaceae bacterium]